ncbi:MAG: FadR family transcriptional regulator [Deltaproteobacteria bacterium]|nr:FadR family transcriptional regulator [Deltaproteobacteria bacterium]
MSDSKKAKESINMYEDIANEIKKAILSGRYKTGKKLPGEAELAKEFGVSRPVVKEAIKILEVRGFLEKKKGTRSIFVRKFYRLPLMENFTELVRYRRVKVDDLAKARLLLEPEVCRLAALKASPKSLKEMQDLIDSYAQVGKRDELDPLYAKFHRLVGRSCGNQIYSIIMENIMDFTESFISTMKPVTTIIHNERDHDEIMEAFRQRDPDKAAEVGTRHAMDILREMKKLEDIYFELLGGNILDPYLEEGNEGEVEEE